MTTEKLKYACCFCKETISYGQHAHGLDLCALVLIGNFDKSFDEQKEQQFFTHFECFRKLVDDDGIMYIADEDFATNGENAKDESEES